MEARSLARTRGGLTAPRSRKLLSAFGDERLVEQLRRGNDVAFEVLYDRHHGAVLSYCRHMLGSRDEAEDALQQAFVSAHADIVSSDKPIRFKAWLYTIARNRCLSILRARREQPSDDLERISTAGLGEQVEQRADLKQLLADMQELPEDQRAALILSELGDLSHGEVAEVIGCEAGKVKSLVFQARSGLIERRQGRETPCEEIREQLATLRGGSLRRGPLRRHLKACPGCAEFREEVRRQRQMVAAILPVIPTLGLRESAFAAVGVGATSAGGGAVLGGGTGIVVAAKAGVAKIAVIALATGGAVGGAVAVQQAGDEPDPRRGAIEQSDGAAGAGAAGIGSIEDAGADGEAAAAKEKAGIPGQEASREAREDDGRGRSDEARAKDRKHQGDNRGFEPERGASNGAGARGFAPGRGLGGLRGLDMRSARAGQRPPHPTHPARQAPSRDGDSPGTIQSPDEGPVGPFRRTVPPALGTQPPPKDGRAADTRE